LLSFGGLRARPASSFQLRELRVVAHPSCQGEIADTRGHLASAYGASDRTLVLIRPDGHVAWISDAGEASAVSDYLAAIG
jgi:hypothetical protein